MLEKRKQTKVEQITTSLNVLPTFTLSFMRMFVHALVCTVTVMLGVVYYYAPRVTVKLGASELVPLTFVFMIIFCIG